MATISAKDVAALRAKTGIGMMECKKALVEAEGDMEKALKLLRERGLAVAAKKESRIRKINMHIPPSPTWRHWGI